MLVSKIKPCMSTAKVFAKASSMYELIQTVKLGVAH